MSQLAWFALLVIVVCGPIIARELYDLKHQPAEEIIEAPPNCELGFQILMSKRFAFPYNDFDTSPFAQIAGCGVDYRHFEEAEQ